MAHGQHSLLLFIKPELYIYFLSGHRRNSGGSLDSGMASAGSGISTSREDTSTAALNGGGPIQNSTSGSSISSGQQKMSKQSSTSSRFSLFGKKNKNSKVTLKGSVSGTSDI